MLFGRERLRELFAGSHDLYVTSPLLLAGRARFPAEIRLRIERHWTVARFSSNICNENSEAMGKS
jgi:hypothetical protein